MVGRDLLALFGPPGSGKGTVAGILCEQLSAAGGQVVRLSLGSPLYQAQSLIYSLAGRPLLDDRSQDGQLLNALGSHFRRINPNVLIDIAAAKLAGLDADVTVIVDDARPADADGLRALGFRLIEIKVTSDLTDRRRQRGDITLGDRDHPTELGRDDIRFDRTILNDSTLEDLRQAVGDVLAEAVL